MLQCQSQQQGNPKIVSLNLAEATRVIAHGDSCASFPCAGEPSAPCESRSQAATLILKQIQNPEHSVQAMPSLELRDQISRLAG